MEFLNKQGQISAGKVLSQIGRTSRKTICNFDFEDAEDAKALLFYFYRREVGHEISNPDKVSAYVSEIIDWMMNGDKCLLMLTGDTGCGKTTMMIAVCRMVNHIYYSNISGTGTDADRRGFQWDNAYNVNNWAKDTPERYNDFKRCEWAAIDDMGQENASEMNFGSALFPVRDVLLYRYDNRLLTIVTTNMTPKQITERYGQRIGDRLAEIAHIVKFNETSYRRQ